VRVWNTHDISPVIQLCTHSVLTAVSFKDPDPHLGAAANGTRCTAQSFSRLRYLDISGFIIPEHFLCVGTHLTALTLHTGGLPNILAERLAYYGSICIPPGQEGCSGNCWVQLKSQVGHSLVLLNGLCGLPADLQLAPAGQAFETASRTGLHWSTHSRLLGKYPKATASSHAFCYQPAVRAVGMLQRCIVDLA
jgi:hypothetical protein